MRMKDSTPIAGYGLSRKNGSRRSYSGRVSNLNFANEASIHDLQDELATDMSALAQFVRPLDFVNRKGG